MASLRTLSIGILLTLASPVGQAWGQAAVRQRPQVVNRNQRPVPSGVAGPMLIETSAPILNLLNRADEGVDRLDWKLAIDSLQRVIEDPEGALVERDMGDLASSVLFESARRQATRRLATLPPEGLEAYRVLFNGKAKGMLDRARAMHDPMLLRDVVDRYLLTAAGDDAADLLASWELDAGRAGTALALLLDLRELVPDSDLSPDLVAAKLVAAYAMLGQKEQAASTIGTFLSDVGRTPPEWLVQLSTRPPLVRDRFNSSPRESGNDEGWAQAAYSIMPDIAPSLAFEPWTFNIGGPGADWWTWSGEDAPDATLHLPPSQLITDGRYVFVRKPGGGAALECDDLTPLWDTAASRDRNSTRRYRNPPGRNLGAGGVYDDPITEPITLSHGLAFTIERGNSNSSTDAIRIQQANPNVPVRASAPRLVARDARTGDIAWQRATGGDPADLLNGAHLRYPPIGVGANLWMPYYKQSDLYFAILDPKDGNLLKSVLLGSAREAVDPLGPALPPVYADGLVFLPTSGSTLFAVDAVDHTVRWARQYDRSSRARPGSPMLSRGWLTSPPLVRGGTVLLAAPDQADLLAFSSVSGDTRWAVALDGASYLIAADTERVWVGGRNITCLSLADGEELWSTRLIKTPSGRAAVCGNRVLVPTVAGLLLLDAADGQSLGFETPADLAAPLGNLSCSGSALYSVEFGAVRKFPDVDRTYARAVARHEARPDDPVTALRLAWAETLRGQPQRAWDQAAAIPPGAFSNDFAARATLARIKVDAALKLARQSPPGSKEALARLEDADAAALSDVQRMQCGFALAEHHVAAGNADRALDVLWRLGLGDSAGESLQTLTDVKASARLEIARRLAEVSRRLPDGYTARKSEQAENTLTQLAAKLRSPESARAAAQRLSWLGQLDPTGTSGPHALLIAAQWEALRGAFERTDLLLGEISTRSADPLVAAAAMVERCSVFAPEALDWPAAFERCTSELAVRFGPVTLPPIEGFTMRIPPGRTVGEWLNQIRPVSPTPLTADASPKAVTLTLEPAWTRQTLDGTTAAAVGRIVQFDPPDAPVLKDRVVTFRSDGSLECVHAASGDTLWHTELRLPADFPEAFTVRGNTNQGEQPRRAVVDGQVAVFNHDDGLYAVGLITGRRLWARAHDAADLPGNAFLRDAAFDARDGIVAALPDDGRLAVLRLLDGSTLWERDLRGESVDRIWIEADRVITSNGTGERIHIFDRAD